MRLFCRSLPCLVIGITAFGAAGWFFRPKPNWRADIGPSEEWGFIVPCALTPSPSSVCWVGLRSESQDATNKVRFWGVSPEGEVIHQVKLTGVGGWQASVDGGLAVSQPTGREDNEFLGQKVTIFGPSRGVAFTRMLKGNWTLCRDGRHAFEIRSEKGDRLCEIVDLQTGEVAGRISLGNQNYEAPKLAPDAKFLALVEFPKTTKTSNSIGIYEVGTGALVSRILAIPANDKARTIITSPSFDQSSRVLKFLSQTEHFPSRNDDFRRSNSHRMRIDGHARREPQAVLQTIDVDDPFQPKTGLPKSQSELPLFANVVDENADGDRIWTLHLQDEEKLYWCLEGINQDIVSWKESSWPAMNHAPEKPVMLFVPNRRELCTAVYEPPMINSLPRFVNSLLAQDSDIRKALLQIRWHDWASGEWRWVGSLSYPGPEPNTFPLRAANVRGVQTRSNAILILFYEDGHLFLQSWPLPPRDPKWPALGVAALCVGATWWLCARRASRKAAKALAATVLSRADFR